MLVLRCLAYPLVLFLALVCLPVSGSQASANRLGIFAAASLKNALDEVVLAWQAQGNTPPFVAYAGSSQLARQLEQGAPGDVFISANSKWMDYLQTRGLTGKRADLLTNQLVLVARADLSDPKGLDSTADFAAELRSQLMATALVDAVPAGMYARQALQYLGLWEALAPGLAQTENVRAALALVALGEVDYAIVYSTDWRAEQRVQLIYTFPLASHWPITYPAALVAGRHHPDAQRLFDFLFSRASRTIFVRHGFGLAG